MKENEAYVAFNLTEQIGSVKVGELTAKCGSVVAAWEKWPRKISRTGGEVDWKAEFAKAQKYGVEILTPADEGYPQMLKDTPGHPLALYVKGNVAALSKPSLAIIGTRNASQYGSDQAFIFGRDLAENGWCIVSGLAIGIDAASHKGALDVGGTTVGVLGSGIDRFYPESNRDLARKIVKSGGAVVTEFAFGRPPDAQTFPQRNRVVASLAKGIIAIECPLKSGTLITTNIAADIGRTVMALPGRVDSINSKGTNRLIRDGARIVTCAKDVESEMGDLFPRTMRAKPRTTKESEKNEAVPDLPFSVEESMIMKHIDIEGISMDKLIDKTGLPAAKVNSICMTLRLKGRVRFFPGNRVALPRQ